MHLWTSVIAAMADQIDIPKINISRTLYVRHFERPSCRLLYLCGIDRHKQHPQNACIQYRIRVYTYTFSR